MRHLDAIEAGYKQLYCRIDVISSPYYAKYPFENLDMSAEDSTQFHMELAVLAHAHKEQLANKTGDSLVDCPASEPAQDYNGPRVFTLGMLDQ